VFDGNVDEMLADRIVKHSEQAGAPGPELEQATQAPPPPKPPAGGKWAGRHGRARAPRRTHGNGLLRGALVLTGAALGVVALVLLGKRPKGR
jgi:hypothetical protein